MSAQGGEQMTLENMKRREFIGGLAAMSVAAKVPRASGTESQDSGEMPYRTLGKTGVKVSAIGLGGFHLGLSHLEEPDAIKIFHSAIDRGINFSDNSWDYNQGVSEKRVGKALKNGYRDKVFVMTKFDGRTKGSALNNWMNRCSAWKSTTWICGSFTKTYAWKIRTGFLPRGARWRPCRRPRRQARFDSWDFTGHKDPSVHLSMLEMADKHGFNFDTAQMPVNVMDAHFRSFGKEVVPVLVKKQMGVLGMKPMGSGNILKAKV